MILNKRLKTTVPKRIPDGPLWPFKLNEEQIEVLREGDPYTYSTQLQQQDSPMGGGMFKMKWFKHYEVLPPDIVCCRIYCDTAQKTKEHNDWSVFQLWALSQSKGIFLIDQFRDKCEAPELESNLVSFWEKHKTTNKKPIGASQVLVEDKSSGSSLIQTIKRDYMIPITPIQRNTDKVLRCMGVVKYFASGFIHLPSNADFTHDYKEEFRKFTPLMTHAFDDQIDPTVDAVEDLLVKGPLYTDSSL